MATHKKSPFGAGRMTLRRQSCPDEQGVEPLDPPRSPLISVTPSDSPSPTSPDPDADSPDRRASTGSGQGRRLSFQRVNFCDNSSQEGSDIPPDASPRDEDPFGPRVASFFCGQPPHPANMRRHSSILKSDTSRRRSSTKKRVTFCGDDGASSYAGSPEAPYLDVGAPYVHMSIEAEESLLKSPREPHQRSPRSPNDCGVTRSPRRHGSRTENGSPHRRASGSLRVSSHMGDYAVSTGTFSDSSDTSSPKHHAHPPHHQPHPSPHQQAPPARAASRKGFGARRIPNFVNPDAGAPPPPPQQSQEHVAVIPPLAMPSVTGATPPGSAHKRTPPGANRSLDGPTPSFRRFGSRRHCPSATQSVAQSMAVLNDPAHFGEYVLSPECTPRKDELTPSAAPGGRGFGARRNSSSTVEAGGGQGHHPPPCRQGSRRVKSFRTINPAESNNVPCRLPTQDVLQAVRGEGDRYDYRDLRGDDKNEPPSGDATDGDRTAEWLVSQQQLNNTTGSLVATPLTSPVKANAVDGTVPHPGRGRRASAVDAISKQNEEFNYDIPDDLSYGDSDGLSPDSPEPLPASGGHVPPVVPPLAIDRQHPRPPQDLGMTNDYMRAMAKGDDDKYVYRDMRLQAAMSEEARADDELLLRSKSVLDMIAAKQGGVADAPPDDQAPAAAAAAAASSGEDQDKPSSYMLEAVKSSKGFEYRDMRQGAGGEPSPGLTRGKSALDVLAERAAAEHAAAYGDAPVPRRAPTSGMLDGIRGDVGVKARDMRGGSDSGMDGSQNGGTGMGARKKSALDMLAERAARENHLMDTTPLSRRASSRRLSTRSTAQSHSVGSDGASPSAPPAHMPPPPDMDRTTDHMLQSVKSAKGFQYRDMRKELEAGGAAAADAGGAEGEKGLARTKSAIQMLADAAQQRAEADGSGDSDGEYGSPKGSVDGEGRRKPPTSAMLRTIKSDVGFEIRDMRNHSSAALKAHAKESLARTASAVDMIAARNAVANADIPEPRPAPTPPSPPADGHHHHVRFDDSPPTTYTASPRCTVAPPVDVDRPSAHMLETVKSGKGFEYRDMRQAAEGEGGLARTRSAVDMIAERAAQTQGPPPTENLLGTVRSGKGFEYRDMRNSPQAAPLDSSGAGGGGAATAGGLRERTASAVDLIAALAPIDTSQLSSQDSLGGLQSPSSPSQRGQRTPDAGPRARIGIPSPPSPIGEERGRGAGPRGSRDVPGKPSQHMLQMVKGKDGYTYNDMRQHSHDAGSGTGSGGNSPSMRRRSSALDMIAEQAASDAGAANKRPSPTAGMMKSLRSDSGGQIQYQDMREPGSGPSTPVLGRRRSTLDVLAERALAESGGGGGVGLSGPPTSGMLASVKSSKGFEYRDMRSTPRGSPMSAELARAPSVLDMLAEKAQRDNQAAAASATPAKPEKKKRPGKPAPITLATTSPQTTPRSPDKIVPGPHVPKDNIAALKAAGVTGGRDMRAGGGSALDALLRQQGYDPDTFGDDDPVAPPASAKQPRPPPRSPNGGGAPEVGDRPSAQMLETVKSSKGFEYRDMRQAAVEGSGEGGLARTKSAVDMIAERAQREAEGGVIMKQPRLGGDEAARGSPSSVAGIARARRTQEDSNGPSANGTRESPTSAMLKSMKNDAGFEIRDMRCSRDEGVADDGVMTRKKSALDMIAEANGHATPPPQPSAPANADGDGPHNTPLVTRRSFRRASFQHHATPPSAGPEQLPSPPAAVPPPPPEDLARPSSHMLAMVKGEDGYAYHDARASDAGDGSDGGLKRKKSALDIMAEKAMAQLEGTGEV